MPRTEVTTPDKAATLIAAAVAPKADLVNGVIPTSQIPAVALVRAVPVANQAAMLALTAAQVQPGDLAIRADGAGSFLLMAADPSQLASWVLIASVTDAVQSVNGQIGPVVLGKADIGLPNVSNLTPAAMPVSDAVAAALGARAPIVVSATAPNVADGTIWVQPVADVVDTNPPSTPTLSSVVVGAHNYVTLNWSASTDTNGIAYYKVYRNGVVISNAYGTSYIDQTAAASTSYAYKVSAVDTFNNEGTASSVTTVTTNPPSLIDNPNLRLYFDMNVCLTGTDTSAIPSIAPNAGSLAGAFTLTQSNTALQPVVVASAINGKKAFKTTAASTQYIQGNLATAITGPTTVFSVARLTPTASTTKPVWTSVNTAQNRGLTVNASGKTTAIAAGTPASFSTTVSPGDVWRVTAVVHDPGTGTNPCAIYDHAQTAVAGALSTDTAANQLASIRFGRTAGSSSTYSDEQVALFAVVEGHMADADIKSAMVELAGLFALTIGS